MEQIANLSITTSMTKAIEIYPLTQKGEFLSQTNEFLDGFFIEFHNPRPDEATLKLRNCFVPREDWFLLFDEAEKEARTDKYAFYGICYKTSVKLAIKRLESKIKKIENFTVQARSRTNESGFYANGAFLTRDFIKDVYEALKLFSAEDEISISFKIAEWPNKIEMEEKEYIKHFEDKIFRRGKFVNDDIPF